MKKIISIILSLLILISALSGLDFSAFAAGSTVSVSFDTENCIIRVFGSGPMEDYDDYSNPPPWAEEIGETSWGELIVEEGVTSIGAYAFTGADIGYISLPSSLEKIGEAAFQECGVAAVEFKSGLREIGAYAFLSCWELEELIGFPDTVESIGEYAFSGTNITQFNIPSRLDKYDVTVFEDSQLEAFTVSQGNKNYSAIDGVLFSKNGDYLISYPQNKPEQRYTVPASVYGIEESAFYNTYNLRIIDLNKTRQIKSFAFDNITHLVVITNDPAIMLGDKSFPINRTGITFIIPPDSTVISYAQRYNNSYLINGEMTVTFDVNGGNELEDEAKTKTVVYDLEYGELPVPEKDGSEFKGWALSKTSTKYITEDTLVSKLENHTLYAIWGAKSVRVTFDAAEGSCDETERVFEYGKKYGASKALPVPVAPKGYTFKNWYTEGGRLVSDTTTVTESKPHKLIAKYTPIEYSVRFNYYNRKTFTKKFTYDTEGTTGDFSTNVNVVRMGYDFLGWSRVKGSSEVYLENNANVLNLTDKTEIIDVYPVYRLAQPLEEGIEQEVYIAERYKDVYYGFSPEEDMDIIYYSTGTVNTVGTIYDIEMNVLATDENAQLDGINFRIDCHLKKGEQYILGARLKDVSTYDKSFKICIREAEGITLNLDPLDGTLEGEHTHLALKGFTYGNLPTPTKTGYTFKGWSTVKGDLSSVIMPFDSVELSDGDTLYANYEANAYKIYMSSLIGSRVKRHTIVSARYNEALTLPSAESIGATKDGYRFAGWSLAMNSGDIVYTDSQTVLNMTDTPNGIVQLYGVYVKTAYDITLSDGNTIVGTVSYDDGKENVLPTAEALGLQREGYVFVGWSKALGSKVADFADGGVLTDLAVSGSGIPTLYAMWRPVSYTVNYYLDNIFIGSEQRGYEEIFYLPSTAETIDANHKLAGFWLTRNANKASEPDYKAGERVFGLCPEDNGYINLYGYTVPVGMYSVVYKSSDGSKTYGTDSPNCENDYYLSDIEDYISYDGYEGVFAGWSASPNDIMPEALAGEKLAAGDFEAGETIILYAVWSRENYDVHFDVNGGEPLSQSDYYIAYGAYVRQSNLPVPTKKGCTFLGWYDSDANPFPVNQRYNRKENVTYYAKWDIKNITVRFNSNGGEYITARTYKYGDNFGELPKPYRTGYSFKGWELNGLAVKEDAPVVYDSDITLKAVWTPLNYTIYFDAGNGTCDTAQMNVNFNDVLTLPVPVPNNPDEVFVGWKVKYDNSYLVDGSRYSYDIDIKAVAEYKTATVTVHYYSNGGTYIGAKTYPAGYAIGALPKPYKEGNKFLGWYDTAQNRLTEELVLKADTHYAFYAKWEKLSYTMHFDADGGLCSEDKRIYTYGDSIGELPSPVKDNYTFLGWYYVGDNMIIESTEQYLWDYDIKAVAKWEYSGEEQPPQVPDGWVQLENGDWKYYADGTARTGWLLDNSKWYYLDADGIMTTGWQKVGNYWYYMNKYGAMQTGWLKDGGKWYYLRSSGAMATGWVKVSDKWYYMNSSGAMQTGWLKLSGKWYYLESSGAMRTADLTYKGKVYKFNSSGVCINP